MSRVAADADRPGALCAEGLVKLLDHGLAVHVKLHERFARRDIAPDQRNMAPLIDRKLIRNADRGVVIERFRVFPAARQEVVRLAVISPEKPGRVVRAVADEKVLFRVRRLRSRADPHLDRASGDIQNVCVEVDARLLAKLHRAADLPLGELDARGGLRVDALRFRLQSESAKCEQCEEKSVSDHD